MLFTRLCCDEALLDSQLGAAVVGGGLQDALKQTTFSVGLQDVKAENVPKVEQLITAVLAKAAVEGFDTDAIEAALNTFEFRLREMNTGGFPKGLVFMLSLLPRWIYREDQLCALTIRHNCTIPATHQRATGRNVLNAKFTEPRCSMCRHGFCLHANSCRLTTLTGPRKAVGHLLDHPELDNGKPRRSHLPLHCTPCCTVCNCGTNHINGGVCCTVGLTSLRRQCGCPL